MVSTKDKEQNPENQLIRLREYCKARGWEYREFVDYASGAKKDRPGLKSLMNDLPQLEGILVLRLDRFGKSLQNLLENLNVIRTQGKFFEAIDQGLKISEKKDPMNDFMLAILGAAAEFERELISERVRDGMARGRVDFVMAAKLRDLNAALKELKRRKSDTESLVKEIEGVLSALKEGYRRRINRSVKRKIVNAWRSFSLLKEQVNDLSLALLGEPIKDNPGSKKPSERKVRISDPARLIYKGSPDNGPPEMKWITLLLQKMFSGKEITTNACEGTFGNMGTLIRSRRSILHERALTKNMLQSGSPEETVAWFNENYPMDDMGRRAVRNHRKKLIVGKSYKITYQDRSTVKTERIIDIRERKRKYIIAYCHLRNAVRTFKRSRIKSIEPV
ncbi:MAG: recombinase family protein [Thermoplasmataceae archaeon]